MLYDKGNTIGNNGSMTAGQIETARKNRLDKLTKAARVFATDYMVSFGNEVIRTYPGGYTVALRGQDGRSGYVGHSKATDLIDALTEVFAEAGETWGVEPGEIVEGNIAIRFIAYGDVNFAEYNDGFTG